jgi:hypothetical protein
VKRSLVPWGTDRGLGVGLEGLLVPGRGCITYMTLYETSGTAGAAAHFWDGTTSNGQYLLEYTLSAGQSTSEQWGHHWLPFEQGLYIDIYAGAMVGSMTIWVDHDCEWWLEVAHQAAELTVARDLAALSVAPGG